MAHPSATYTLESMVAWLHESSKMQTENSVMTDCTLPQYSDVPHQDLTMQVLYSCAVALCSTRTNLFFPAS